MTILEFSSVDIDLVYVDLIGGVAGVDEQSNGGFVLPASIVGVLAVGAPF